MATAGSGAGPEPAQRREVIRDAVGIGVATGAYAISFGAVSTASGLTVVQTCALSLLLFSGASQFALVGVLAVGGGAAAAAATALLLGSRNAFYGLRLSPLLRLHGVRRMAAAQLVIDESTAMAVGRDRDDLARLGFAATGVSVFALWNLGTLVGALGAKALSDPKVLGLDAAAPAAFVALLAPQLRGSRAWTVLVAAAAVALVLTPLTPAGVPVLAAAATALVVAVSTRPASA